MSLVALAIYIESDPLTIIVIISVIDSGTINDAFSDVPFENL